MPLKFMNKYNGIPLHANMPLKRKRVFDGLLDGQNQRLGVQQNIPKFPRKTRICFLSCLKLTHELIKKLSKKRTQQRGK